MTTLSIQRGDTWERTFTASQGGSPFDLNGVDQVWLTFRHRLAKPGVDISDGNATLQLTLGAGITIADALAGQLDLLLTPQQTQALVKDLYYWDLQLRLIDGRIKTADSGQATILAEVTVSV